MKIAYKATGIMILLGLLTLLVVLIIFSIQNNRLAIESAMARLSLFSNEIAQQVGTRLEEKVAISLAFSSAPIVSDVLIKSNREYEKIPEVDYSEKIKTLNDRWKNTKASNDVFIQKYLNNTLANYLKLQQRNMPGLYGEIFLTNRFGVMVASTGRLTTLTHAHKYWWLEAFNGGEGKIFFDDRGFDESVSGYVIGIVIPIKVNNEIIGILKSNINVMGLLKRTVQDYEQSNFGEVQIVRSGGLIVAAEDIAPLSESLSEDYMRYFDRKKSRAVHYKNAENSNLISLSPIAITMGTEIYGFGGSDSGSGSGKSIDHRKGNLGEGWHVVLILDEDEALVSAADTAEFIVFLGIIFTVLIAISALFLGKIITRPLVKLTDATKKIGRGDFDIKATVSSQDEIGVLAESFNKMASSLKETMVVRDALREETEERKSLNALFLESVADGIFGVDQNGIVTFINPAATAMLGYNLEEMMDQPASMLISRVQDKNSFSNCMERIIAGEITGSSDCRCCFENLWCKDGSSFSSEYTITSIKQGDEVLGAVVTFRDITERVKMADESAVLQRQLLQSQKMEAIGKLTGGVAHDFNNMLSAILGFSNLAIDICGKSNQNVGCNQADTLRKYINEVIKAADRSKNLVSQLLAFSRGDMGEIKCLKLNHFVEDVMQMLRATIPSSIELISRLPENDVYVKTDAVQLNQTIMNLVINARDAIKNQTGTIEVGASAFPIEGGYCSSCHDSFSGDFVELFVRDTGSGMGDGIAKNIFDPFFTTKEMGAGTGMGLAMVHGIVHASGGHIRVQTEEGNGTTITLFFPEVPVESYEEEKEPEVYAMPTSSKGHILVVDDEAVIGDLINEQLSNVGYEVTLFTNPLEALEQFLNSPELFDLVITDQTMPEMTGDDLSRRLLEIRKDIPIILSTGFSSKIDKKETLAIGISQFMEKPLSKENLLRAIGKLLQN